MSTSVAAATAVPGPCPCGLTQEQLTALHVVDGNGVCTSFAIGSNKTETCGELFVDHPTALSLVLAEFLWNEAPLPTALFPPDHFVLNRQRVVDAIKVKIASYVADEPGGTPSVYLSGCSGSGKTSLLTLLARSFQADGYQVYFFQRTSDIPQGIEMAFKTLLKNRSQKVAVLIDEVEANPNAALFTTLLKSCYPHLVVIGAAVPRYSDSGVTAKFAIKVPMSEICLRQTDDDFQQLIDYCVGRDKTTPELTATICRSLLDECDGHVYPTLKFIEYFFTRAPSEVVASEEAFRQYFGGPAFVQESVYQKVMDRCFDTSNTNATKAAIRVLRGQEALTDIDSLVRVGWWNGDARDFVSQWFVSSRLSRVPAEHASVVYLDQTEAHVFNTALVIAEGLWAMEEADFFCSTSPPVANGENAVSFNWAYQVKRRIPNAHLTFQARGTPGLVVVSSNDAVGTAIEVLVNATRRTVDPVGTRTSTSQDIDAHAERLVDGAYPWSRYALFNFALAENEVVLPSDPTMWDKTYTFVYQSNALYRGQEQIKANVVQKLRSGDIFMKHPTALSLAALAQSLPAAFRWEDVAPLPTALFPTTVFGQYVLHRPRVVDTIKVQIASYVADEPCGTPSVYLSGCTGSGKTSLLTLLARSFQADGYQVYFFQSASAIPHGIEMAFKTLLKNRSQKVAVLIDEVVSNQNAALFTTLLKSAYSHLVVIGAAVPRYASLEMTAKFSIKVPMREICLRQTDDDFRQLIDYCVGRDKTTPELTETICRSLLDECGGHVYPTLKFIEYFFTRAPSEVVASEEAFRLYFGGPAFVQEGVYQKVMDRCFDTSATNATKAAMRVLRGQEELTDIDSLVRVGWWNEDAKSFVSQWFVNTRLSSVPAAKASVVYLDQTEAHVFNTALVIAEGLSVMEQNDFFCSTSPPVANVESVVSFNWAYRVRTRVPNAHLTFQERGIPGLVVVYSNDAVGTAIEVLVNATRRTVDPVGTRTSTSQDIDAHAERLVDGAYPWSRFVLFNFALAENEVVLPSDPTMWDTTYTFVYQSNALYRGKVLIKANVVQKLRSGEISMKHPTALSLAALAQSLPAAFLWEDVAPLPTALFPTNVFHQYVLNRQRVVDAIKVKIASYVADEPCGTPSVYLSGCSGSGKTSLLTLLARSFQADGYQVYFFQSASDIPQGISFAFEKLLQNRSQKVAVLIDEVESNPNAALFTTLLKSAYPHLVVIGAAVPRYSDSGVTAKFAIKVPMREICLRQTDEDFRQLIDICVGRKVTTPELTETICRSLLDECGGHVYPTLKFIEYFFTRAPLEVVASEVAFRHYFGGPAFVQERVYRTVLERCFDTWSLHEATKAALRVLGGQKLRTDTDSLLRVGWWNGDTRDFISPWLVRTLLSSAPPEPAVAAAVYLDDTTSSEEITALLLAEGLSAMEQDDFFCRTNATVASVEKAVAFNWAYRVRTRVPNVHLTFQERGTPGLVAVYLNDAVGTAIEVLVNATRRTVDPASTRASKDIYPHTDRLVDGAYPWSRFALVNFALAENEVVLPSDPTMWDKTYTFVYKANALYRGKVLIKANVVGSLKIGPRRPTFTIGNVSAAASRSLRRDIAAGEPSMMSTVSVKGKGKPLSTAPKTRAQHQELSGVKSKAKVVGASEEEEEEKEEKKKERVATRKHPPTDAGYERTAKRPRHNPLSF